MQPFNIQEYLTTCKNVHDTLEVGGMLASKYITMVLHTHTHTKVCTLNDYTLQIISTSYIFVIGLGEVFIFSLTLWIFFYNKGLITFAMKHLIKVVESECLWAPFSIHLQQLTQESPLEQGSLPCPPRAIQALASFCGIIWIFALFLTSG